MEKINVKHIFYEASDCDDQGDYERAFELFMKGASLNDNSCMTNIGYYYDIGRYVRKDKNKALCWYKHAYKQNEICSPLNIGIIYQEKKQWKRALWWFHKAVAMGNIDGNYHIAMYYHKGRGVKKNIKKAIKYYTKVYYSGETSEYVEEEIEAILKKLKVF